MSTFTPGKWWVAPPIFEGDVIFAPAQHKGRRNEVVAMGILNKADSRLIAAAPEMYRLLQNFCYPEEPFDARMAKKCDEVWELLKRIDGEEAEE